jgi:hypothetical protein
MPRANELSERNATIAAKVKGGRTFADVGREYNLDRTRIKQICRRFGVRSPQPYEPLTDTEKAVLRDLHAREIPIAIAAREVKRRPQTVRDFLVRENLHLPAPVDPLWTTQEDTAIRAGYYELGSRKIALALRRTRNEVIGRADRLRKMGLLQAPKEQF